MFNYYYFKVHQHIAIQLGTVHRIFRCTCSYISISGCMIGRSVY